MSKDSPTKGSPKSSPKISPTKKEVEYFPSLTFTTKATSSKDQASTFSSIAQSDVDSRLSNLSPTKSKKPVKSPRLKLKKPKRVVDFDVSSDADLEDKAWLAGMSPELKMAMQKASVTEEDLGGSWIMSPTNAVRNSEKDPAAAQQASGRLPKPKASVKIPSNQRVHATPDDNDESEGLVVGMFESVDSIPGCVLGATEGGGSTTSGPDETEKEGSSPEKAGEGEDTDEFAVFWRQAGGVTGATPTYLSPVATAHSTRADADISNALFEDMSRSVTAHGSRSADRRPPGGADIGSENEDEPSTGDLQAFIDAVLGAKPSDDHRPLSGGSRADYKRRYFQNEYNEAYQGFEPGGEGSRPLSAYIDRDTYHSLHKDMDAAVERQYEEKAEQYREYLRLHQRLHPAEGVSEEERAALGDSYSPSESRASRASSLKTRSAAGGPESGGATDEEDDNFEAPPVIETAVKSLREQLLEDELRQAEALVQETNYFAFLNGAGEHIDPEIKAAAVAQMKLRERQNQSKTWLEHFYPQLSRQFYPPMLPWSLLLTYFVQYNVHLSVHPQIILPEMVICCKNRASDKQLFSFRWVYNTGSNNANKVKSDTPDDRVEYNGVSFMERDFNANNIIHYYFQEALEQQQQRAAAGKISPSEMVIASLHSDEGRATRYLNMAEFYKMFGTAAMVGGSPGSSRPQSSQQGVFSTEDSPMCFRSWRANDTLIFQAHPMEELRADRYQCRYENFIKEGFDQTRFFKVKSAKSAKDASSNPDTDLVGEFKELSARKEKHAVVIALCQKILVPFIMQLKEVLTREFNRTTELITVSFYLKDGAVFWITDINVQRRKYTPPPDVISGLNTIIKAARKHVGVTIDNMLARKTARKFSYQVLRRCVLVSTAFELARRNMAPVITKGIFLATQADTVTDVLQEAKNTVADVLDDTITEFAMISVEGAMEGQSVANDASVDQAISEIELVFKVGGCARTVANRVIANIDRVREKSIQDRKDYIASFVDNHAFSGQYMPFSKVLSVLVNFASDSLRCSLKLVDTFLFDKDNGGVCWYYTDTNFNLARRNKVAMKSVTSKFLGYYNKNKELSERRRAASRVQQKRVDGAETDGWMDEAASVCSEVSNASYTSILEHGEDPDAPPVPAGIMTNSDGSSIVLGLDSMNTLLKSKLTNLKLTKTAVTQIALPRMHDEDANGSIVYLLRFRQFGAQPHDIRVDFASRDPADMYETFAPRYSNISPYTADFEEAFGEDSFDAKLQMESTMVEIIRFFDLGFGVCVIDAIFEFVQDRRGVMWLSFISHFGVMHPVDLFTAQYANQRVPKLLNYVPRNTPSEHRNAISVATDWQTMYYDKQQLQANVGSMGADGHLASEAILATAVSEVTLDRGLALLGGEGGTEGGEVDSIGPQSITEISSDSILCWADLLEYLCYCTVYGSGENHSAEDPEPDVLPFLLPDTIISDETDNHWDRQNPCLRCYFLHPSTGKLCCARNISTEQMLDQCSGLATTIKRKNASLLAVAPYVALLHHYTDGWQNLKEVSLEKMDRAGALLGGRKANFLQLNNGSGARIHEFFVCSYIRVHELQQYDSIFQKTFNCQHVDLSRGSGMQYFLTTMGDAGADIIRCEDSSLNAQLAEITTQVLRIIASTSFKLVLNLTLTCFEDKHRGMMVAGVTEIIVKDVTFEDLLLREAGLGSSPQEKPRSAPIEDVYVPEMELELPERVRIAEAQKNNIGSVLGSPTIETGAEVVEAQDPGSLQGDDHDGAPELITCPNCSISLMPEFKFCYSCGQQLGPVQDSPERNISSRAKTVPRMIGSGVGEDMKGFGFAEDGEAEGPPEAEDDKSLMSLLTDGAAGSSQGDISLISDVNHGGIDMSVVDSNSLATLRTVDSNLTKASMVVHDSGEPRDAVYPEELPEAEWGTGRGVAEGAADSGEEGEVEEVDEVEYTPFEVHAVPRRLSGSSSGPLELDPSVVDESTNAMRVSSPSAFNYAKMASVVLRAQDIEDVEARPRPFGPLMPPPCPIELFHMNRLEIFDLLMGVGEDNTVKVGPGIKTPMLLFYDAASESFGMCECAGKGTFSKFVDIPDDLVAREMKRTIRNYPSGHSVEAVLYDMETNDHQLLNSDEFVEFLNNGFAALKSNPSMVLEIVFVPVKIRCVDRFTVRVEQHNLDHHASSNRNLVNYADAVITIKHDTSGVLGAPMAADDVSVADTRKITTILLRFLRFLALGCGYAVADCSAVFAKFDKDWEVSFIHISYYSVDRPMNSMLAEPESFAAIANMGRNCHIRLQELTYVDLLESIVERNISLPFVKMLPIAINTANSVYYQSPESLRQYEAECRVHYCYFSLKSGEIAKTKVDSWEMVRASFSNFAKAQLPPSPQKPPRVSPTKDFDDNSMDSWAVSSAGEECNNGLSLSASIDEQVADAGPPVPPIAMLCNFLPSVQSRGVGLLDDVLARPGTTETGTAGAHLFTEGELVQWLATRGISGGGQRGFVDDSEGVLAVSRIRTTLGDYLQVYMPSHCAAVEEQMRKSRVRMSAKASKKRSVDRRNAARVAESAIAEGDEDSEVALAGGSMSMQLEESSEEEDAQALHMRNYMPKVAEGDPFDEHNSHREVRLYCKFVHTARDNNITYASAVGAKLAQGPSLEEWADEDDYEKEIHAAYNSFQFGYREINYSGSVSAVKPLGHRRREKAHQAYCNSHSSPPVTASGKTRPIHRKNMCKYDLDDEVLCSQMMDISKKFIALFDAPAHLNVVDPIRGLSVPHMQLYRAEFEFVYNIHTRQLWLSWVKDVFAHIPTEDEIDSRCDIDGSKIQYVSRLKMVSVLDQLLVEHAAKEEAARLEEEERLRVEQEREWEEQERQWREDERLRLEQEALEEERAEEERVATLEREMDDLALSTINAGDEGSLFDHSLDGSEDRCELNEDGDGVEEGRDALLDMDNLASAITVSPSESASAVAVTVTEGRDYFDDGRSYDRVKVYDAEALLASFQNSSKQAFISFSGCVFVAKGGSSLIKDEVVELGDHSAYHCILACSEDGTLENITITLCEKQSHVNNNASLTQVPPTVLCVPNTVLFENILRIWQMKGTLPLFTPMTDDYAYLLPPPVEEFGEQIDLLTHWFTHSLTLFIADKGKTRVPLLDSAQLEQFFIQEVQRHLQHAALTLQKVTRGRMIRHQLRRYLDEKRRDREYTTLHGDWRAYIPPPTRGIAHNWRAPPAPPPRKKKKKVKKIPGYMQAAAKAKAEYLMTVSQPLPGRSKTLQAMRLPKFATPTASSKIKGDPAEVKRKRILDGLMAELANDIICSAIDGFYHFEPVHLDFMETLELIADEPAPALNIPFTAFLELKRISTENNYSSYAAPPHGDGTVVSQRNLIMNTARNCMVVDGAQSGNAKTEAERGSSATSMSISVSDDMGSVMSSMSAPRTPTRPGSKPNRPGSRPGSSKYSPQQEAGFRSVLLFSDNRRVLLSFEETGNVLDLLQAGGKGKSNKRGSAALALDPHTCSPMERFQFVNAYCRSSSDYCLQRCVLPAVPAGMPSPETEEGNNQYDVVDSDLEDIYKNLIYCEFVNTNEALGVDSLSVSCALESKMESFTSVPMGQSPAFKGMGSPTSVGGNKNSPPDSKKVPKPEKAGLTMGDWELKLFRYTDARMQETVPFEDKSFLLNDVKGKRARPNRVAAAMLAELYHCLGTVHNIELDRIYCNFALAPSSTASEGSYMYLSNIISAHGAKITPAYKQMVGYCGPLSKAPRVPMQRELVVASPAPKKATRIVTKTEVVKRYKYEARNKFYSHNQLLDWLSANLTGDIHVDTGTMEVATAGSGGSAAGRVKGGKSSEYADQFLVPFTVFKERQSLISVLDASYTYFMRLPPARKDDTGEGEDGYLVRRVNNDSASISTRFAKMNNASKYRRGRGRASTAVSIASIGEGEAGAGVDSPDGMVPRKDPDRVYLSLLHCVDGSASFSASEAKERVALQPVMTREALTAAEFHNLVTPSYKPRHPETINNSETAERQAKLETLLGKETSCLQFLGVRPDNTEHSGVLHVKCRYFRYDEHVDAGRTEGDEDEDDIWVDVRASEGRVITPVAGRPKGRIFFTQRVGEGSSARHTEVTDKPLLRQLRSTMYFLINKLKNELDLGDLYYLEIDCVATRNGLIYPKGYVPAAATAAATTAAAEKTESEKSKSKKGSQKAAFFEEFQAEMDAHLDDVLSFPYKPMLPPIEKKPKAPRQPTFKYSVWLCSVCCYNCDYVRVEYEEERQVQVEEEIPEEQPSPAALMAEGSYKEAEDKCQAIRDLIDAAIASNQAILSGGPRPRTVHEKKAQADLERLPVDDAEDLVVRRLADVSAQVERLAGLYLKQPELARQEEVERLRRLEAEAQEQEQLALQQRHVEMVTMDVKLKSNDYAVLQRVVSERPMDSRNALHRAATPATTEAARPQLRSMDFFTFCKKVCNSGYTNIFLPFTAFPNPALIIGETITYCAFYATTKGTLSKSGTISVEKMLDISAVYQAFFDNGEKDKDVEKSRDQFSAFLCYNEDQESCYEYSMAKESPPMTVTTFLFPYISRTPVGREEVEGVSAVSATKKGRTVGMFSRANAAVSDSERSRINDCHSILFSPEHMRLTTAAGDQSRAGISVGQNKATHSKVTSFLQASYYLNPLAGAPSTGDADLYYLCYYEYRPPGDMDRAFIDPLCYHYLRIECRRKADHLQRNHSLDTVLQTLNTTLAEIVTQPVTAGRYISKTIQEKMYLVITESILACTEPGDPATIILSAVGLEMMYDPRKQVLWLLNSLYAQCYPNDGPMAADITATLSSIELMIARDPFKLKSFPSSRSPSRQNRQRTDEQKPRPRQRPLGFEEMKGILATESSIRFDRFHETSPEEMLNLALTDKLHDLMREIPEPVPTPPSLSRANTPTIEGNIESFIEELITEEAVEYMASAATTMVYKTMLKELYAFMVEDMVAELMLKPIKLTKKQRKALATEEARKEAEALAEAEAREEEAKKASAPVTFMAAKAAGIMKGFLKKKIADVSVPLSPVNTVAEHEPAEEELKVVRGVLLKATSKNFGAVDLVEAGAGATLKPLPPSKKKDAPMAPLAMGGKQPSSEDVKSPRQKKVRQAAEAAPEAEMPRAASPVTQTATPPTKTGGFAALAKGLIAFGLPKPKPSPPPEQKPTAAEPPAPAPSASPPGSVGSSPKARRKKKPRDASPVPAAPPVVSPASPLSPGERKGRKKKLRTDASSGSLGSVSLGSPSKARDMTVTNTAPFALSWADILEKFANTDKFRMLIPANIFYIQNKDTNHVPPASYTGYFNMAGGAVSSKANFETSKIVGSFKKFVESQNRNAHNYVAVLNYRNETAKAARLLEGESKESEEDAAAGASVGAMERVYLTASELRTLLLVSTATAGAASATIGPANMGAVVSAIGDATGKGTGLAKFKSLANAAATESRNDKLMRLFKQSPDTGCAEPSHIHVYVKSKVFNSTLSVAAAAAGTASPEPAPHMGTDPTNTVIHAVFDSSDVPDDIGSTHSSPSRAGTAVSNSALNKRVEKGLKFFVRTAPDEHNGFAHSATGNNLVPMEEFFTGIEEYIVTKDALVQAIQKVLRQLTVGYSSLQVMEKRSGSEAVQVETTVEKATIDLVVDASNMIWFLSVGVSGMTVTMTGKA